MKRKRPPHSLCASSSNDSDPGHVELELSDAKRKLLSSPNHELQLLSSSSTWQALHCGKHSSPCIVEFESPTIESARAAQRRRCEQRRLAHPIRTVNEHIHAERFNQAAMRRGRACRSRSLRRYQEGAWAGRGFEPGALLSRALTFHLILAVARVFVGGRMLVGSWRVAKVQRASFF
jgi:hypothetical protein